MSSDVLTTNGGGGKSRNSSSTGRSRAVQRNARPAVPPVFAPPTPMAQRLRGGLPRLGLPSGGALVSMTLHAAVLIALSVWILPRLPDPPAPLLIAQAVETPSLQDTPVFVAAPPALQEDLSGGMEFAPEFEEVDPREALLIAGFISAGESMSEGEGGGAGAGSLGVGETQFFGTVAQGNDFVFIIDVSPSMQYVSPGDRRTRLQKARDELAAAVSQLTPAQRFHVIAFSWRTTLMFGAETETPAMIPATEENKELLYDWIARVQHSSGTDPRLALYRALNMRPSVIFFLSDGEFNMPIDRPARRNAALIRGTAVDVVARESAGIPIHTIAFEDARNRHVMARISQMTGGEFRFVPAVGTVADGTLESRAQVLLEMAERRLRGGRREAAVACYEKIIEDYPSTSAAQTAQRLLDTVLADAGE